MSDLAPLQEPDPDQISADEHSELVAEIDRLFTSRAAPPEEESPHRRSGVWLPILVNVTAVLVLAAAIYAVLYLFAPPEEARVAGELQITQAAVAEALQEEAARQIAQREAQIGEIRQELRQLQQSRQTGDQAAGDAVSARELQLQRELEALLAREQAAPAESEAGREAADAALAELAGLRDRQEFVVTQLRSLYQGVAGAVSSGSTAQVTGGLNDIDQLLSSNLTLQAGLDGLARALEPGNRAIRAAVAAADRAGADTGAAPTEGPVDQIRTLVEQADTRFAGGETDLAERLYRSAVETLDSTSRAYSQLASLEEARVAQNLRALNSQIDQVRSQLAAVQSQLRERDSTIVSLRSRVDSLTAERDAQAEEIAALEGEVTGLERELTAIEQQLSETRQTAASRQTEIRQQEQQIQSLQAQIAALRETADQRARSMTELSASAAARAAELESIRQQVAQLEREIAAELSQMQSTAGTALPALQRGAVSPDRVVDLLGTKVQLREAVDLPAVRNEYPTLYNDMELYFDAFAAENELSGRRAALSAASSWVEEVLDQVAPGTRSFAARGTTAEGYLQRLEALLTAVLEGVE